MILSKQYIPARVRALLVWLVWALVLASVPACTAKEQQSAGDASSAPSADVAYPVQVHHATGFKLTGHQDYQILEVGFPQAGDTVTRFLLYPKGTEPPQIQQPYRAAIPVPVQRVACMSTTEVGALPLLGKSEALVGATSLHNINSPEVKALIDAGRVTEIGQGMQQDMEQIVQLHPDVLLQDGSYFTDKTRELYPLGINAVPIENWKEENPLARAEWIKVMGALLGVNGRADSLFRDIEARYVRAKHLIPAGTPAVEIMYGEDYKGMWNLPGEHSYITALFRDAGIQFESVPDATQSLPVNFEYVFSRHRHNRLWLVMQVAQVRTVGEFLRLNEHYKHFDATGPDGQVWVNTKRINPFGGNDYWESALYHPDLLLQDLIKIAHPHLLPDYETVYWIKLKPMARR